FFQAEDGIRDFHVTGVQTCALPIFAGVGSFGGFVGRIGFVGQRLAGGLRGLGQLGLGLADRLGAVPALADALHLGFVADRAAQQRVGDLDGGLVAFGRDQLGLHAVECGIGVEAVGQRGLLEAGEGDAALFHG